MKIASDAIIKNIQTWIQNSDDVAFYNAIRAINHVQYPDAREQLLKVLGDATGKEIAQEVLRSGTPEDLKQYSKKLSKILDLTEVEMTYAACVAFREKMESTQNPFVINLPEGKQRLDKKSQEIFVTTINDNLYSNTIDRSEKVDILVRMITDYEKYQAPRREVKKETAPDVAVKPKIDVTEFRKRIWAIDTDTPVNTNKVK
jgi:hypothetical protein